MEGNGFRDRIQEFQQRNAIILGISFDSAEDNRAFKEKFDFPYDLLCDTGKTVSIAYGAADDQASHPSRVSYLIDPAGKIAKVYESVTPADHPDEVLADLG
ncbi:MAG: peroxiredoxin [Gemmatimonadetes bacterium]|nr:peroxiredoxin [Gemmatimonadota bacterium]MBT6146833.1 peroxiredoxin [Gemmatimonadota bacterium]MBT7862789.1 peroxiredoxin [Gemmatimonadota bacterium]